jgi:hypothetical protein
MRRIPAATLTSLIISLTRHLFIRRVRECFTLVPFEDIDHGCTIVREVNRVEAKHENAVDEHQKHSLFSNHGVTENESPRLQLLPESINALPDCEIAAEPTLTVPP